MAIELASRFSPFVDELFSTESRKSTLTNSNFDWTGAHSIKVYDVSTSDMNDYQRNGPTQEGQWSRYGVIQELSATTQEMTLRKDRSFTFEIDTLDEDETKQALQASTALARQLRNVAIPEQDEWVYLQMCENAGHKPAATGLTATNIYDKIVSANTELDNAEVPETDRVLVATPDTYLLLKKCRDIVLETNIGNELRLRGVISILDGMNVLKIPANRLPADFGFMIAHPVATVAPTKLASYKIHIDPPGISGSLVEGRLNYDAFVLKNKAVAIYYQAKT